MDSRSILVVEDDLALQRYLLRFFSDRGYHSILVPTLARAVDALVHDEFQFTVVDVASDPHSTFEAASRLKPHRNHAGVIIALTDATDVGESLTPPAGIDRLVAKVSLEMELGHVLGTLAHTETRDTGGVVDIGRHRVDRIGVHAVGEHMTLTIENLAAFARGRDGSQLLSLGSRNEIGVPVHLQIYEASFNRSRPQQ